MMRTLLAATLTALALTAVAQPGQPPLRPITIPPPVARPAPPDGQSGGFKERLNAVIARASDIPGPAELTRFDLDFPGGTPRELVAAIQKAMGKPLNVIIPEEQANTKIPPLRLTAVDVPQLFQALTQNSRQPDLNGNLVPRYTFTTDGAPTDFSIWRFQVPQKPAPSLTRFDLDFPGGTPKQLVAAIQKSMGKPLNAIVPEQHANIQLPPLKMNNVTAAELFRALAAASLKTESRPSYPIPGPVTSTSYGFRSYDNYPTDDSVWYFYVDKPATPPPVELKVCRFYPLAPYLDRGFKVDDITTAIQTGWKMLGEPDLPSISFHKDTKLLIAVGDPAKLETIDAVLKALDQPKPALSPTLRKLPGVGVSSNASKTDE